MRTLSIATALLLLPLASAADCTPTSSSPLVAAGDRYVYNACLDSSGDPRADEECMYWGTWNTWIYEESNGIAGLQRADELRDDTCNGLIRGDKVIF